jgi:hypothetical protein
VTIVVLGISFVVTLGVWFGYCIYLVAIAYIQHMNQSRNGELDEQESTCSNVRHVNMLGRGGLRSSTVAKVFR